MTSLSKDPVSRLSIQREGNIGRVAIHKPSPLSKTSGSRLHNLSRFSMFFCVAICFTSMSQSLLANDNAGRKSVSLLQRVDFIPDKSVFEYELQKTLHKEEKRRFWKKLPVEFEEIIVSEIGKSVFLDRFDVNPLPGSMTTLDNSTVAHIKEILEVNSLLWSRQFISETDKRKFISAKAKELAVTVEDLQNIMNSAYIAVPVCKGILEVWSKTRTRYKVAVGLHWYHVNTGHVVPHIYYKESFLTKNEAAAMYFKPTKEERKREKRQAFRKAVSRAANLLKIKTRGVDAFKVSSTISSMKGNTIEFWLGSEDDISLDNKFKIFENVRKSNGVLERQLAGFASVTKVGNRTGDTPTESRAKVIRKNRPISVGMELMEHPKGLFGYRIGLRVKTFKTTAGRFVNEGEELFSLDDRVEYFFTLGAGFEGQFPPRLGIPQFYGVLEGFIGTTFYKPHSVLGEEGGRTHSLILGANIGVMKKIYLGSIAITMEGGGGFLHFNSWPSVPESIKEQYTDLCYSLLAWTGYYGGGFEYAASIDVNLGISVLNWTDQPSGKWDVYVNKEEKARSPDNEDLPAFDLSGLEVRLYVTRSVY